MWFDVKRKPTIEYAIKHFRQLIDARRYLTKKQKQNKSKERSLNETLNTSGYQEHRLTVMITV